MLRGDARVKAVMREIEEMDARVRICRVDFSWIVVRVLLAREAEGRKASDGRVTVERL